MKFRPACLALLALLFTSSRAEEFPWPGHGTLTFDVPAGWTLQGRQVAEAAFSLNGTPKSHSAALVQITALITPADHPINEAFVQSQLQGIAQQFVTSSVEGKIVTQPMKLHQGYGWYVQFTDASLVGKPPVPNNFKMMRNALIGLDDHAMVIATMQFDDPGTADPAAMLALVSSIRFNRNAVPPASLSLHAVNGAYDLTVPESRLRLKIPAGNLQPATTRIGGGTNNPRYFELAARSPNLIISGWFEPAGSYHGIQALWQGDFKAMTDGGLPPPINVQFLKAGKWDVVSYEVNLGLSKGSNAHIRAELTQDGTWVDLHFSITSELTAAAAHDRMMAVLASIQVEAK